MSADRIYVEKRKASHVGFNSEIVGFSPQLKPIVTARLACHERLLEIKADATADIEGEVDLVSSTQQIDAGVVGSILSNENVDVCVDSNNLTDADEGCETPKSEEHKIAKILTCPPAPRKPRPTARRKTESAAAPPRALFVHPNNLNLLFGLQQKKIESNQKSVDLNFGF